MAVAPDMAESEVAEFVYTIHVINGIEEVSQSSKVQIYPLPVRDRLNVTASGKAIRSAVLSTLNGVTIASASEPSTKVTLDVSRIPTGIYIINVITVDGTFSRKILKVD